MIVYGDSERVELAGPRLAEIARVLEQYAAAPAGIGTHARLVGAFIALSEVVQGIADSEMEAAGGVDVAGRGETAGNRLLLSLAGVIGGSWGGQRSELPSGWRGVLAELDLNQPLRMRQAEGYLHYALYPEGFFEAARGSGLGPDTVVIGLRSIGTGLAAMVAAGLGAKRFFTLRPVGHPFARTVAPGPELARDLLQKASGWAVVDEGPGKSGSSFGGVVDWLEANGVDRKRIHLFPSHAGAAGDQASAAHRERWNALPKHVAGFSGERLAERLTEWLPPVIGRLDKPLEEISGGGWRSVRGDDAPADRQMEKLKFLATAGGERYLVKFVGLGEPGQRKVEQAKALAGFVAEPVGTLHGFLVERWVEGRPLSDGTFDRSAFLDHAAEYLGARARLLAAPAGGASFTELADMAAINVGERLGEAACQRLRAHLTSMERLQAEVRPVFTDNRLQPWEWLLTTAGQFVKCDALDHASGHDLIGCQDITWDIAGLAVEFDLTEDECRDVIETVEVASGRPLNRALLRSLEPCYAAFQIGLWTDALGRADGEDRTRIEALLRRYTTVVEQLLGQM